jgi:hypothetical protein
MLVMSQSGSYSTNWTFILNENRLLFWNYYHTSLKTYLHGPYKDIKVIPLQLVQHCIKFDTSIPFAHQAKHRIIPNYVTIVNQDLNEVLATCFLPLV